MANYNSLRSAIINLVYQNGNNEITGNMMQNALLSMITSLGAGYQFGGVATPSTNPGTPDHNVFYIAGPGTFPNFNSAFVPDNSIGLFSYNGSWNVATLSQSNLNAIKGYWRDTSGTTLNESLNASSGYNTALLQVKEGDIFHIVSTAGITAGNYATYNSSLQRVRRKSVTSVDEDITIESGEAWLVYNATNTAPNAIYYKNMANDYLKLRGEIESSASPILNLSTEGTVYTARYLARNTVPAKDRKEGTILTYLLAWGTGARWITEQNINTTTWNDAVNWIARDIVEVKGLFDNNSVAISSGKITAAGQCYLNKSNHVVYICTSYTNPSTMSFAAMYLAELWSPFIYEGYLCFYDGTYLIKGVGDLEHISRLLFDLSRTRVKYVTGKNLFNKNNVVPGVFNNAGTYISSSYYTLSNIIEVVPGEPLHINVLGVDGVNGAWYDAFGQRLGLIPSTGQIFTPPAGAKYATFVVPISYVNTCQIEYGTVGTAYENYWEKNIADNAETYQEIIVTCKRQGVSGVDADFCGLTAISDAINSITDASKYKRYRLIIDGIFEFTTPSSVPMLGNNEYSIIYAKPYISYEGLGPDKTILSVNFPSDATFPSGKHYYDYQPIYVDCDGEVNISNMSVLGTNCRYAIHLEHGSSGVNAGAKRTIKNCRVIHYGMNGIQSAGFEHGFGCGIGYNHDWTIEDCYIEGAGASFAIHTALQAIGGSKYPQGTVNINHCKMKGTVTAGAYQNYSKLRVNFNDCEIDGGINYRTNTSGGFNINNGLYNNIDFRFSTPIRPLYNQNATAGAVLRVRAKNNGGQIRFGASASAFSSLISNVEPLASAELTDRAEYLLNGYYYRDGGVGVKGYAYGIINANSNGLAKGLGDCSGTSKTLSILINGTNYSVTFNQNYNNLTNNDVLTQINTILGTIAEADIYNPDFDYLPQFEGIRYLANEDEDAILAGMGVVLSQNGIKKAQNSDGYIYGICLDDIAPGIIGRIATKGIMYGMSYASISRFYIKEVDTALKYAGVGLGIRSDQPGVFDKNATPVIIRYIKNGQIQI